MNTSHQEDQDALLSLSNLLPSNSPWLIEELVAFLNNREPLRDEIIQIFQPRKIPDILYLIKEILYLKDIFRLRGLPIIPISQGISISKEHIRRLRILYKALPLFGYTIYALCRALNKGSRITYKIGALMARNGDFVVVINSPFSNVSLRNLHTELVDFFEIISEEIEETERKIKMICKLYFICQESGRIIKKFVIDPSIELFPNKIHITSTDGNIAIKID